MTSVSGQCGPLGKSLMLFRLFGGMIVDSTCRHRQWVLKSLLIGGKPVKKQTTVKIQILPVDAEYHRHTEACLSWQCAPKLLRKKNKKLELKERVMFLYYKMQMSSVGS